MNWSRAGEENGKRLRKIVTLLLALADIAECAGGRSRAACGLLLWLLRPAEQVTRDYVADLTGRAIWDQAYPDVLPDDDGPAGAMRLALSFRALASVLAALAASLFAARQASLAPASFAALAGLADGAVAMVHTWPLAVGRRDSS